MNDMTLDLAGNGLLAVTKDALAALRNALMRDSGHAAAGYFQEAGYATSTEPKALKLAQNIRTQCRQILRNADGYEIWPNY